MQPTEWDFYQQMLIIRIVEESLLSLFSKGLVSGTIHTSIGQEAVAVGVVTALDKNKDIIWSNHRGHGHFLTFTGDAKGIVAEIMGKASGVCGGIGGSQHLHARNFYTNGVLGGTVPCAVGSAFAEKKKGSGAVVAVFFGDGAMGEGIIYESLNFASLCDLPVLFVLENNQYAQTTPTHMQHAGNLEDRAAPYGIKSKHIDTWDVNQIYEAAVESVQYVRKTSKPCFLTCKTYRLAPHSKGDDFRPQDEIDRYRKHDPLSTLRAKLKSMDPQRLLKMEHKVQTHIQETIQAAENEPGLPLDAFLQVSK